MFFQDCLDSVFGVARVSTPGLFSLNKNKKQLSQENKLDSLSNRFERVPEKRATTNDSFISIFRLSEREYKNK